MAENLYDILGVKKSAKPDEIRRAYRKLARKYHPDVNPGDEKAESSFKKVSAANDVLSDPEKRKAYDEFGEDSLKGGFDPEKARAYQNWQRSRSDGARPFGFGGGGGGGGGGEEQAQADFDFGDLFGWGRAARSRPTRGADMHAVVDMDLAQAIQGGEVKLEVPGRPAVTVRIPPGADTGSVIRLPGKGAAGPEGAPAGDLVIETRVRPHPLVERDGLDLYMEVPVTLAEAYEGGTIEIPTFHGPVKLRIPPRSPAGAQLRLREKGVHRKDERGDLIVELAPRLPDRQSEELERALRAADALYSTPVRKELRL